MARNQVHHLIRGAKAHFENGRSVEDGAYLKPYKKLLVDVTASEGCLDKALRLANELFNALESLGYRVVLAPSSEQLGRERIEEREVATTPREYWQHSGLWSPRRPTVVYVGSVPIGLAVVEMSERTTLRYVGGKYVRENEYVPPPSRRLIDHSWTTERDLPSGRLRIVAYSPYHRVKWSAQWQETRSTSLRAGQIVEQIAAAAPDLVAKLEEADRQAELRRQEWLAAEERRRRDEDRKRVEQSVADSKAELQQIMQRWFNVMSTEAFLAGVEQRIQNLPEIERLDVLERLSLARAFVGTLDPLAFLRTWKTPEERYTSVYAVDEEQF